MGVLNDGTGVTIDSGPSVIPPYIEKSLDRKTGAFLGNGRFQRTLTSAWKWEELRHRWQV